LNKERPKDINICTGISDKPGKLKFRQYDSNGLSTFSSILHTSYESGYNETAVSYKESELNLVTLKSILDKNAAKKEINFLKVDVEGFEYNVLKGNDWKKYRPWVICIESTGADKRWQKLLAQEGYIKHLYDGLNDYYVAKEHSDLIENYHAIVSSAVIRYDVAFLPNMKYSQKLRDVKNKVVRRSKK
jgi:FkbM family methyltransferase